MHGNQQLRLGFPVLAFLAVGKEHLIIVQGLGFPCQHLLFGFCVNQPTASFRVLVLATSPFQFLLFLRWARNTSSSFRVWRFPANIFFLRFGPQQPQPRRLRPRPADTAKQHLHPNHGCFWHKVYAVKTECRTKLRPFPRPGIWLSRWSNCLSAVYLWSQEAQKAQEDDDDDELPPLISPAPRIDCQPLATVRHTRWIA